MKLIQEHTETVNLIVEAAEGGKKNYFLEGPTLQGVIKNRNGRIYEMAVLNKEVSRYTEQYIDRNRAYGELGHPDTPSINLDRVSHMIKSLKLEGNNYVGRMKILDTPHGRIVKSLIDEGAQLGVSSRGLGSLVERNGANYVQDDFQLATAADIVADPSAPDAFMQGIMEGRDWVYDVTAKSWVLAEQIKKIVDKTPARKVDSAKLFEAYLRGLK